MCEMSVKRFLFGAFLVLVLGGTAAAKTLDHTYQAVMHIQKSHALPVLDDGAHVLGIAAFRGLAIFSEDDIAVHRYEGWFDLIAGSGRFHGYASWTFEDGSELRADYSGMASNPGSGGLEVEASFENFSGTGRFEIVSGEGGFTGRRLDPIDKGGNTYLNGMLKLTVPD